VKFPYIADMLNHSIDLGSFRVVSIVSPRTVDSSY
jgi:hypothetical protein